LVLVVLLAQLKVALVLILFLLLLHHQVVVEVETVEPMVLLEVQVVAVEIIAILVVLELRGKVLREELAPHQETELAVEVVLAL
jgi:hypothetical protein